MSAFCPLIPRIDDDETPIRKQGSLRLSDQDFQPLLEQTWRATMKHMSADAVSRSIVPVGNQRPETGEIGLDRLVGIILFNTLVREDAPFKRHIGVDLGRDGRHLPVSP